MTRMIVQMPADLKAAIERAKPDHQSTSEWVREAIRQRLDSLSPKMSLTRPPEVA